MGCQACVTACAMENNIPFVGEDDAGYGRGMHWIRTERFWNGVYPNISTGYQPMLCQQCGHAPCEAGLPGVCLGPQPIRTNSTSRFITVVSAPVTAPTTVPTRYVSSTGGIGHARIR